MSKLSRPLKTSWSFQHKHALEKNILFIFEKHVSQEKEKSFKQLKMHINQKPAQNATETNWLKECYRHHQP